jgi:hypothetical protein
MQDLGTSQSLNFGKFFGIFVGNLTIFEGKLMQNAKLC